MEQRSLEDAVRAIDAAEAEDLQETVGLPINARVISNSLMLRVNKDTDGALTLKADMENTQFYYEAIIRVCSETATLDKADGWGMSKKHPHSVPASLERNTFSDTTRTRIPERLLRGSSSSSRGVACDTFI